MTIDALLATPVHTSEVRELAPAAPGALRVVGGTDYPA
jgi:hypothetical protein